MILKDLITDVLDATEGSEIGKFLSKKNPSIKSITRANKDLVMTFPVMVSSTVDAQSGQLIGRALERKFVTLTQMLLSALSITTSKDAIDHLKNIHSNLDLSNFFDVDDYISISNESALDLIMDPTMEKMVYESYKNQRLFGKPLNHLKEYDYTDDMKRQMNLARIASMNNDEFDAHMRVTSRTTPVSNYVKELEKEKKDLRSQLRDVEKRNRSLTKAIGSDANIPTNLPSTKDADYKKANELQPTVMKIEFISTDGENPIKSEAYVGIKTKLYAVNATDIHNHVVSKRSYNFSLYNLIKATSGEIEFWRDFIFAIKKAKIDALSNTNRGSSSKLWKVLERRALSSKINRLLSARNDATAITTLVLSSYDVDMLRKSEDIDLADSKVARKLMDDYNLIGIVVVDDSTESATFIFDTGDDEYELYTFKTLKRDEKMDYKQMIQLLAGGR